MRHSLVEPSDDRLAAVELQLADADEDAVSHGAHEVNDGVVDEAQPLEAHLAHVGVANHVLLLRGRLAGSGHEVRRRRRAVRVDLVLGEGGGQPGVLRQGKNINTRTPKINKKAPSKKMPKWKCGFLHHPHIMERSLNFLDELLSSYTRKRWKVIVKALKDNAE